MTVSLPPRQQQVAPGKWPVVGESAPARRDDRWQLEVCGRVERPLTWPLTSLHQLPVREVEIDLHCVTRWSRPAVRFRGVRLADVLDQARPLPDARFISWIARSERLHSTSLPLQVALELGAMLVWESEGQPLAVEHGGPLRMIVPGRYLYKSLKWLERIELLDEDRLGYWESTAGYHNEADPWLEQRFMAGEISKQQAQRLIDSRDFSGQSLRGLVAAGRDLQGLNAREALLRDADFSRTDLRTACFDGANLSNARFVRANLRETTFRDADLEGADFAAADLSEADLRGASLFGASFFDEQTTGQRAVLSSQTRIDAASLGQLTPPQAEFLAPFASDTSDK